MIAKGKEIKIFTGSAHGQFAVDVCRNSGSKLGGATVARFADGEVSLSMHETVRGFDVFLIQSTSPPVNENLMELLVMIDACRRASAGRITAVIPYFGYARQDRKSKPRDPISAKLVANLLATAGADRILTMDLHAAQVQGFFDIPVDNLLGSPLFVDYYTQRFADENMAEVVAVSPDVGSVARVREFAHRLGTNFAIVDKYRSRANESEVMNIIGEVKDRHVILFDDMVDTGGSLCNAARALIEKGGARDIYACATHGVLTDPALERIAQAPIHEMVFLDTIPFPSGRTPCEKIKYISVAPLFAEAIDRIYEEVPISPLFK